jgi:hypothetical protein
MPSKRNFLLSPLASSLPNAAEFTATCSQVQAGLFNQDALAPFTLFSHSQTVSHALNSTVVGEYHFTHRKGIFSTKKVNSHRAGCLRFGIKRRSEVAFQSATSRASGFLRIKAEEECFGREFKDENAFYAKIARLTKTTKEIYFFSLSIP